MYTDDEATKYISSLKDIIKALTVGLESAVQVMEKWDELELEKREYVIKHLKSIIENSTNAYSHKYTQTEA
jgi:hypothetical protein